MRAFEYAVTNREGKGEIFCLITAITDPGGQRDATAAELAAWRYPMASDAGRGGRRQPGWVAAIPAIGPACDLAPRASCATFRSLRRVTETASGATGD